MDRICVTNTPSYEKDIVKASIDQHFQLLNLHQKIRPEMRVLIKPNLLMKRTPEEATTSHPQVIAAIIENLQAIGVKEIVIADSPGGRYTVNQLKGIYETTGMQALADTYGVTLNFDITYSPMSAENTKKCHTFNIITPILNADFIIDVAKLKTHCMTTLSGAVKNLFGAVPGLQKPKLHYQYLELCDFCDMLLDLSLIVKADVAFVDAVVSMQGDGPSAGELRQTGLLLSSENIYALDTALCTIIGIDTDEVLTVKQAIERGLSPATLKEIEIVGDQTSLSTIPNYKMPTTKSLSFLSMPNFLKKQLESRPVVHLKKCIGCGKCAESCPADTIKIEDKKAIISYERCIKCFCCHEMCPIKIISIKNRMFSK